MFTAACPGCGSDCEWTAVPQAVTRELTVPVYSWNCRQCDPPPAADSTGLVGRLIGLVA